MLSHMRISGNWVVVAAFMWIAASGAVLLLDPMLALAVGVAPVAVYLLVSESWLRIGVMVGGGMLVLGSSSDVGPVKMIYAGAMLLCVAIAGVRLVINPPVWAIAFRPSIGWGAALVICLVLGTIANPGQDPLTVVRQAIFYTMIPLAPLVGIDAGRDIPSRLVMRWIGIVGCVAAVGFSADWLARRGVSGLSIGRFVVSSALLPTLAFALALVMLVYARGWARVLWVLPVVIIPTALLVTGTRSSLVIFVALLGMLGPAARRRIPVRRALLVAAVMFGAAVVALPLVAGQVISRPGFLESRIQALLDVVNGTANDQSYAARNEQYYFTAQWIGESPWFGKGPGFSSPISLDTPLATIVHVGIVGTFVLIGFLASIFVASRGAGKQLGYSAVNTAATGVVLVALASLPFGTPVEDKGFAFTLALLTMGISAHLEERSTGATDPLAPRERERGQKLGQTDSRLALIGSPTAHPSAPKIQGRLLTWRPN